MIAAFSDRLLFPNAV